MAGKIDLSLDDIIKSSGKTRGRGQFRGRPATRKSVRGLRGNVRGGVARGGVARGGVQKRSASTPNGKGRTFSSPRGRGSITRTSGTAKLLIENLHFDVNNSDIKELFAEFGVLKKAVVHYDCTARSLGTAEVIYDSRVAAQRAIQKYNGVLLDGRPMSIQIVGDSFNANSGSSLTYSSPSRRGTGVRDTSRGGARAGRRGSAGVRGRGTFRGRGRPKNKVYTTEELDAQLDEYNSRVSMDLA